MQDFKVREKPYKTLLELIFWVLERGLGDHNFDSRVGFIAKVSSGSIGDSQRPWRTSKWTIARCAQTLIKPG